MSTPIVPTPDSTDNLKRCSKCGELKLATREFFNASGNYLHSYCKVCKSTYQKQYSAKYRRKRIPKSEVQPPTEKCCAKCGVVKPISEFSKATGRRDGYQHDCKACNHAYYVEHARDICEKNRAKRAAVGNPKQAEYYRNRPRYAPVNDPSITKTCLLCHNTYPSTTEYFHANDVKRDGLASRCKACRNAARRQYKDSPEVEHVKVINRRKKIRATGKRITAKDVRAIRASQTDKIGRLICWRCCKPITGTPHLDHFIPLDKGGQHVVGNLHYMHAKCNLSKADKHPHELGMLI